MTGFDLAALTPNPSPGGRGAFICLLLHTVSQALAIREFSPPLPEGRAPVPQDGKGVGGGEGGALRSDGPGAAGALRRYGASAGDGVTAGDMICRPYTTVGRGDLLNRPHPPLGDGKGVGGVRAAFPRTRRAWRCWRSPAARCVCGRHDMSPLQHPAQVSPLQHPAGAINQNAASV